MTVHTFTLHATMFVSSFIAGIALYYLLSIEQVQFFLQLVEPSLREDMNGEMLPIILRTAITFLVITIFASNPILNILSYILIAGKIAIFSICSMFLVVEHQNIVAYSMWWFPVQLVQCIVLILYFVKLNKVKRKPKQVLATIVLFSMLEISILLAELVIIRYV